MAPMNRERFRAILRDAADLVWRARRRLLLGIPLMLVNRVSGIVIPWTTKYLIDDVLIKGNQSLLWTLALISATAAVIAGVTDYALALLLGIAAQRSITDLRKRIQQHVQRLPVRYFDSTKTGVLVSRVMSDADGIRNLVGTGLVQILGSTVSATLVLGLLFYLSAKLALIILVVIAFFMFVLYHAFNTARPLFRKRGEINAEVTGRLSEGLSGIRILKAYRGEKREARVFAGGAHKLLRNIMATMRTVSGTTAITSLLIGIVSVVLLIVGAREVLAHRMTVGGLVTFSAYLAFVVGPIAQIVAIGTQLSEAFAGLERIREIMGETPEDAADAAKPRVADIRGRVEFRDVEFAYSPDKPVLKGVSFVADAGKSIALVGPSGSGKSTLISLVAAFHQPTAGTIFVDGRDLGTIRIADYRSHLGLVPQESFLFADSIYDNIVLGNTHAAREEVLRAARIAHVDEFAEAYEEGYATIVGERGVKLSGGQKQRVAIARAIIADPRILILDEATSSLDSESEALIQDGLNALMKGRTTFVIAHRLSTVRNADLILVLEDGRVTERGTHEELMARGGKYRALYEKQYGVAVNRFVNAGEEVEDFAEKT